MRRANPERAVRRSNGESEPAEGRRQRTDGTADPHRCKSGPAGSLDAGPDAQLNAQTEGGLLPSAITTVSARCAALNPRACLALTLVCV